MAKQKGNVVTHGLRGKVGDLLIFRQVDGETIVSKIPESSKTVSEGQKRQRKNFQKAIFYAKSVFEGDKIEVSASDVQDNITVEELNLQQARRSLEGTSKEPRRDLGGSTREQTN
jgi:hypothetical protein